MADPYKDLIKALIKQGTKQAISEAHIVALLRIGDALQDISLQSFRD